MNARPTMKTRLAALGLIALPLLLAGCGNKGPLILPPKNIPAPAPEQTSPIDDATVPPADGAGDALTPPNPVDDSSTDTVPAPLEDVPAPQAEPDDGGRG
jgi:predicted small lipoprotein YifL